MGMSDALARELLQAKEGANENHRFLWDKVFLLSGPGHLPQYLTYWPLIAVDNFTGIFQDRVHIADNESYGLIQQQSRR